MAESTTEDLRDMQRSLIKNLRMDPVPDQIQWYVGTPSGQQFKDAIPAELWDEA